MNNRTWSPRRKQGTCGFPCLRRGLAWKRRTYVFAGLFSVLAISACQQKMAHQPYFRPLEESEFFADGRSARPLEHGTIARGQFPDDHPLMTGLTAEVFKAKRAKAGAKMDGAAIEVPADAPNDPKNYVDVFPFQITEKEMRRGMERFTIFCTPCHSPLGDGNGKIVERGYLKPTSYHGENARGFERYRVKLPLRDAPVGYYFEVMSKGFGAMPDYASQIPPKDRWCIIAYIRALQLSQSAKIDQLPADLQKTAKKEADRREKASKEAPGEHHP